MCLRIKPKPVVAFTIIVVTLIIPPPLCSSFLNVGGGSSGNSFNFVLWLQQISDKFKTLNPVPDSTSIGPRCKNYILFEISTLHHLLWHLLLYKSN